MLIVMKRLFVLMMIALFSIGYSQNSSNRFEDESSRDDRSSTINTNGAADPEPEGPGGPGNPGADPVPIDDYIPVLVMTALGIILYTTRKKRKWS